MDVARDDQCGTTTIVLTDLEIAEALAAFRDLAAVGGGAYVLPHVILGRIAAALRNHGPVELFSAFGVRLQIRNSEGLGGNNPEAWAMEALRKAAPDGVTVLSPREIGW